MGAGCTVEGYLRVEEGAAEEPPTLAITVPSHVFACPYTEQHNSAFTKR